MSGERAVEWIESNPFGVFDAEDTDWKSGEEKEVRAALRDWYNSLPADKRTKGLKGFIESPVGINVFITNSTTLPDGVKKSNEEYVDKIERIINGKNKARSVFNIDVDEDYLEETIAQINRLKEDKRIELSKREAAKIEDDNLRSFKVLQERFRVARDRGDADALRDVGQDIRNDDNLSDRSRESLLERIIIALDNLEGR